MKIVIDFIKGVGVVAAPVVLLVGSIMLGQALVEEGRVGTATVVVVCCSILAGIGRAYMRHGD